MVNITQHKLITQKLIVLFLSLFLFHTLSLYDYECKIRLKRKNISLSAKKRRKKERLLWSEVNLRISDLHFRRMFRMTRKCFDLLCSKIIAAVGERAFKSEAYIDAFLKGKNPMYDAHVKTCGGYISGEVKLAVTLRLLAGGDALDLGVIFDIVPHKINMIVYSVLRNWIKKPNIGGINMQAYLNNDNAMENASLGFSQRSHGVLKGAIGAIDGWLVRIRRPSCYHDGIKSPITFFSRKGFYALNVQCIVDDKKRVLWASYSHKGASHDSSCLQETQLYDKLISMKTKLYEKGYFLLGDSAYGIESFLLPPYPNTSPKTPEDDFNFYQSSARITVECAFGEIDLRWGIFWKRLCMSLDNAADIIEGAMHLHNFLVNYRESLTNEDKRDERIIERHVFEQDILDNGVLPLVVGEDLRIRGRPLISEKEWKLRGLKMRDNLKISLMEHGLHRPRKEDWNTNQHTHIVRTNDNE